MLVTKNEFKYYLFLRVENESGKGKFVSEGDGGFGMELVDDVRHHGRDSFCLSIQLLGNGVAFVQGGVMCTGELFYGKVPNKIFRIHRSYNLF